MGVIQLLDEQVSQLIAAGEVVERPSSVVKELVENAIDAGASKITVEIRHGGVTLIRVSDNGSGILPEDVPMMFVRHATSKVRTREDLGCIATLGFRGEAMASIHAVARVEVLTRCQGSEEGVCYRGEGASLGKVTPAGCPVGTTIRVSDLFYNTPARMKFLKKDVQEGNSVAGVVERIALSHPEISFQLIREGQTKLHTPGDGRLRSAIHAVYGREFTEGLAQVDYTSGQIRVSGYVTLPSASRANRTMQTFFVNGRFVKSVTARTALEEAYKHAMMVGKFPACVLELTIPVTETDINVHPAKIEVRFTNERPVFDAVYDAVRAALNQQDRSPLEQARPKKPMTVFDLQRRPEVEQTALSGRTQVQSSERKAQSKLPERVTSQEYRRMMNLPKAQPAAGRSSRLDEPLTFRDHEPQTVQWEREHPLLLAEEPHFTPKPTKPTLEPISEPIPEPTPEPVIEQPTEPTPEPASEQAQEQAPLRLLGEVLGTYLVLEGKDEVILVDKHAAHERLIFNRLRSGDLTADRQLLLEPVVLRLSREDYQGAVQNLSLFEQAGFSVEDLGDGDLMVREVPILLTGAEIRQIVESTAHDLARSRRDLTPQALDELLHSVACKSAVRANDQNHLLELWELVQLLQNDPEARYCPHGRPVARVLSRSQLEQMFGRQG